MTAMNEQPPSKDQLHAIRNRAAMNVSDRAVDDRVVLLAEIESLQRQVEALSIHSAKWVTRAIELQGQLAKPAHEREGPHCSTCGCGMSAHAPLTDAEIDAIANEGHRNAAGGIYATSVYVFARAIESRAAQPPRDGQ
jgi:hypothetical protein